MTYAKYLFPKAQLASQRISEALADIGSEDAKRKFFREYFHFLEKRKDDAKRKRAFFFMTSFLCFEIGVFFSYIFTQLLGVRAIFCDGLFAIPAFFFIRNERNYAK